MSTFRMQQRRGTTSDCASCTDIPKDGEIILEKCSGGIKMKIGDGIHTFSQLSYIADSDAITKLSGIASGAQVNIIEGIKVNGTSQTITNKTVDVTVPTKTSDLTNDSGFLTSHQDISGKVDKITGKGLSTNDYDNAAKTKVDAIPANPQYTDTVYDDTVLSGRVTTIEGKIPEQASSSNKLADKAFVNSSIGTNTAYYISNDGQPFTSVAQLEAYSGTITNNDYAFVTGTENGNSYYDRYKAIVNGSTVTWSKEYRLNNSSFTAAQWSTINSGLTNTSLSSYRTASAQDVIDSSKANTTEAGYSLDVSGTSVSLKNKDGTVLSTITTQDTDTTYSVATTSADGLMSASDKSKLDGIAANANTYTLPVASSTLGGIKSGTDITVDASGNVTVDQAHQLVATDPITTTDKFVSRSTAGTFSVTNGLAEVKSLKGNTIVWNQLVRNGNFSAGTTNWNAYNSTYGTINVSNNVITYTVLTSGSGYNLGITASIQPSIVGHKYLIEFDAKCASVNAQFGLDDYGGVFRSDYIMANTWGRVSTIWTCSAAKSSILPSCKTVLNVGDTYQLSNIVSFDLTAMFGAGNEPSTVAEFKAMFPLNYYAYNAGELKSFNAEGIETIGFNQWDEEYTDGYLYGYDPGQGVVKYANATGRTSSIIRVFPNTTYYANKQCSVFAIYTDEAPSSFPVRAGNYLANISSTGGTFTTNSSTKWICFSYSKTTTDICINLSHSGARNGEYEAYEKHYQEFPVSTYFPNGMRSAGTVYDELLKDKAVTRIGAVDLGSLSWLQDGDLWYTTNLPVPLLDSNAISNKLTWGGYAHSVVQKDDKHWYWSGIGYFEMYVEGATTASDVKTAMSGVMLYYELATPTEVTIDPPFNDFYYCDDYGTEEWVYPAGNTVDVPGYSVTAYTRNLIDEVRNMREIIDAETVVKADKVRNAVNGHLAGLDSNGSLTDSGKAASDITALDTAVSPLINQWDEQWELGIIDSSTGANTSISSSIRTKGFISVTPLTEYFCVPPTGKYLALRWYDANKNYLGYTDANGNSSLASGAIRKAPSNAHFLRFWVGDSVTTYNNDISINYPSTYTGYYPSVLRKDETHIGGLGNAIGMRGWNQLVQNGNFVNTSGWTLGYSTLSVSGNIGTITSTGAWSAGTAIMTQGTQIVGHKYYLGCSINVNGTNTAQSFRLSLRGSSYGVSSTKVDAWERLELIGISASAKSVVIITNNVNGATGDTFKIKDFNAIDLTALFGAGNEPSSVEDFRAMFPADYYPYCSGIATNESVDSAINTALDTVAAALVGGAW